MAKKGKKAKAAAAAAAAAAADSETTNESPVPSDTEIRVSKNRNLFEQQAPHIDHTLDENSTSFSLPNSPVIKVTRSIQPSPTLSATVSQGVDEDFGPVFLPPLSIGEILDPGVVPDIDWSLFDTQPARGKKKPKQRGARLSSPVRADVRVEEPIVFVEPLVEPPAELFVEPSVDPFVDPFVEEPLPIESPTTTPQESVPVKEAVPFQAINPVPVQQQEEAPPKAIVDIPSPQQQADHHYFPQYPVHTGYFPRGRMSYPMPYGYGPGDGSPYGAPYGHYPAYPYPHARKLERHDSMASRGSNNGDPTVLTPPQILADASSSAIEDDPSDGLLGRLHLAIPDLELLLRRYKETHGELGLRKALVRKKEAEAMDNLKRKEEHIDRLMGQFHDAEKKHGREYNKLRLHIGNLEENMKELQEQLHISELQRKHEASANKELTEQSKALVRERMLIAKAAAEERDRLVSDYETSKSDAQKQLDTEKIRVAELVALKDALESKINSVRSELESQAYIVKAELESKASAAQEAAENAEKENEELKEQLATEKDANANGYAEKHSQLVAELEEQKQALIKTQEEEIERLKKEHKDDLNEQTRAFVGLQENLNKKLTSDNQNLLEEIASLKKAWDDDKSRFEKMIADLKGVAKGMEEEKGRLEKIVEQFADETDVKSKGDLQYIESFKQLSDLVFQLSSENFKNAPVIMSPEIIARLPDSLVTLQEDSPAGHRIRSAYICHLVSSILVERVFTPFLFGLGRRSEDTETLLSDVSDQLRGKGARREAIWRQQTLLAAYTTTDAKSRMNKEAGRVMDEIMEAIMPFCAEAETKFDDLRMAVRKIVKLAVETWRYARLERERIEAFMPPAEEEVGEGSTRGIWLPFCGDGTILEDIALGPMETGDILLRVFPLVRREKVQENLWLTERDHNDQGCVYYKGAALYINN